MSPPKNPLPSRSAGEDSASGEPARAASASSHSTPANPTPELAPNLDPADFYFDGPYLVFTAAYHLKRGSCCHSGCRHCPYRDTLED